MNKRDELILKYAEDLKEKCNIVPDVKLLEKVTIACGPSVYKADASLVSSSNEEELERIKKNFLIGKLGLKDGPELDKGLEKVIEMYGPSNRNKYRAVVYYLLTKIFKKESVFN